MVIRRATANDIDDVLWLYEEVAHAMVGTPFDCRWRQGGHPSRELVSSLVLEHVMFLACEGDDIVGAVGADHDLRHDYGDARWLIDADWPDVAVVHLLTTRPDCRGGGIARMLLLTLMADAREHGMRSMRLDVTHNNAPALELYRTEGFEEVARETQVLDPKEVRECEDPHVTFVVLERVL